MALVNIKINGQPLQVEEGKTVLEAAAEAGIDIPVLCHHPKLPPIGACRMCVVETRPGILQTACTLPVTEGLEVQTESPNVIKARKFVLNLLFSERNHYCMYCEVSGDCELQSLGYRYGLDHFDLPAYTTRFPVDTSHPYILLEHNRCILCRRCIRACSELAGHNVLGISQRGISSMLTADMDVLLGESSCVSCGLCVQVCPTGALSDKKGVYIGTNKECEMVKSICTNCSVGCGIDVYKKDNHLVRIWGDWEAPINSGVLCKLGRYEPVFEDKERVIKPMIKRNGILEETKWEEVISIAKDILSKKNTVGFVSSSLSSEVLGLFSKLLENNVTIIEDINNPFDNLGRLTDILSADKILLVGVDLDKDFGVVGSFVKRAVFNRSELILVDNNSNSFVRYARLHYSIEEIDKAVGTALMGNNPVVVYSHLDSKLIEGLTRIKGKAKFIWLAPSANSLGARRLGLNGRFEPKDTGYILAPYIEKLPEGLSKIIVQTSYYSKELEKADIVLPSAIWLEEDGTFINLEGKEQKRAKVLNPPESVKANEEIISMLLGE
ncbi:MAG: molybdopterin-dependent oxidoreductase [bacterium]